jgi:hypothetical protein
MNLSTLKNSRVASRVFLLVALIGAIGFVAGPMIRGRTRSGAARTAVPSPQQQQLEQQAAGLRQRLASVQQKVLSKNPDLSQRQRTLVSAIEDKMKQSGSDPAAAEQSIRQLQARVQDPKVPESERKQAMAQAVGLVQSFERARAKALQDPKIAAQVRDFRGALMAAMQKEEPQVGSLMRQLEETEAKLEVLHPPS